MVVTCSLIELKNEDSGEEDTARLSTEMPDISQIKIDPPLQDPGEHQLQFSYAFWYCRQPRLRSYDQNLKMIGTFSTVGKFWSFYSHLVRPSELTGQIDFHLFKEGIRPMWEDEANRNGGRWVLRLRKGLASRCWENLILAILGEQFMVGEEICGAMIAVRFQEDIISVWNKTGSDNATTIKIRDTLKRVLNLPPNTYMEYKMNCESLRWNL
ncbi:eukaryotic translation initiation factor 4E type 2-like isoform X1 [Limulus polyphemus]|uniref:eIF-4F 25 kDa subunit n=1 Tax=Limulus polyphemus TaxID=6850 RepID=A0ABM1S5K8_LIMPO|nr:eukaryotic translation initiation factor 4E type 2-like isoform X1 [Limulus polyphemus]